MNKYEIKRMIPAARGAVVHMPIIPASLTFRRAYLAEMRRLIKKMGDVVRLQILTSYKTEIVRDATESDFNAFKRLVQALLLTTNDTIKQLVELEATKHTAKFAEAARSAFKIDLAGVIASEDLTLYVERMALRNAGLVTGMTDDLVKRVQFHTTTSLIAGEPVSVLRKKLKKEFEISDSRAQLIARDQTAKLNADLNKIRHIQAGVTSYVWRTARDERVRSLHHDIDKETYEYGEATGAEDGAEPGQPIRCRCIAQGVVAF